MKYEMLRGVNKMNLQTTTKVLNEIDSRAKIEAYHIPQNRTTLATSLEEALEAANNIGYPVVLKVVSDKIVHKTDFGGVHVHLNNDSEVTRAYESIYANAQKKGVHASEILGVSVQKMEFGIVEMIVGAKRDKVFGPVIVIGLGGVFVELMNDTALGITPLTEADIGTMLRKLRGFPLLDGYRGKEKADVKSFIQIVLTVQKLMLEEPNILEIDLNPIMVKENDDGAVAVDARIVTTK